MTPTFFGDGTEIAAGDIVETWLDTVRVKVRLDAVDGEALSGAVEAMEDDYRKLTEHEGLAVGSVVELRAEHVRSCWKHAA
ncbi:MAG: hypothetical protein H0W72_02415 [Planctomycetes bacterium]|nr:hypothetical protein [Planctomycetota bacterium]